MKVLILDNYDSFTFNLYQLVGELMTSEKDNRIDVIRNDELTVTQIEQLGYDRIIISPGPGSPDNAADFGVCAEVIRLLGKTTPILGVCLGMQGIATVFGAKLSRARVPVHGKTSKITHNGQGLFLNLPSELKVMRYHSIVVDSESLGNDLIRTASTSDGIVMGLAHKKYSISGIQFHPESFATEGGKMLMRNFLEAKSEMTINAEINYALA